MRGFIVVNMGSEQQCAQEVQLVLRAGYLYSNSR